MFNRLSKEGSKALRKADNFIILCFMKYETQPVSKLLKRSKLIGGFVIAKVLKN
jgi:hypothetical protein